MKIKEVFKNFFSSKFLVILTGIIVTGLAVCVVLGVTMLANPSPLYTEQITTNNTKAQTDELSSEETQTSESETETETETENKTSYKIMVNIALNCVTIYKTEDQKEYTPFKAMICSSGLGGEDTYTPIGEFALQGKAVWCLMIGDVYTQYATRITGGIMFHSIPYAERSKSTLYYNMYNILGNKASHGCIRLCASDAKWIFDNCPYGTPVTIYQDYSSPGPLGKPTLLTIPYNHPLRNWDPTDPDENNPWRTYTTKIEGDNTEFSVPIGTSIDTIIDTFTAHDSYGNNLTYKLIINGTYNMDKAGRYKVNLTLDDWYLCDTLQLTINVYSEEPTQTTTTPPEYSITNLSGSDTFDLAIGATEEDILSNFSSSDGADNLDEYLIINGSYDLNSAGSYTVTVEIYKDEETLKEYGPITINIT